MNFQRGMVRNFPSSRPGESPARYRHKRRPTAPGGVSCVKGWGGKGGVRLRGKGRNLSIERLSSLPPRPHPIFQRLLIDKPRWSYDRRGFAIKRYFANKKSWKEVGEIDLPHSWRRRIHCEASSCRAMFLFLISSFAFLCAMVRVSTEPKET